MNRNKSLFPIIALLAAALFGCGTTTGNPQVTLSTSSYVARGWLDWLIQPAYASVSGLTLCFKRVRFKASGSQTSEDKGSDPDNLNFEIGEVSLTGSEKILGSVAVPPGTYSRIEFDFDDHCASGKSIQVSNGNGNFDTNQTISIKFNGTFVVESEAKHVSLDLQSIIGQLNSVNSNSGIKNAAEAAGGSFHD